MDQSNCDPVLSRRSVKIQGHKYLRYELFISRRHHRLCTERTQRKDSGGIAVQTRLHDCCHATFDTAAMVIITAPERRRAPSPWQSVQGELSCLLQSLPLTPRTRRGLEVCVHEVRDVCDIQESLPPGLAILWAF